MILAVIIMRPFYWDMLFNNQHKFPLFRNGLGTTGQNTSGTLYRVDYTDEKDYATDLVLYTTHRTCI